MSFCSETEKTNRSLNAAKRWKTPGPPRGKREAIWRQNHKIILLCYAGAPEDWIDAELDILAKLTGQVRTKLAPEVDGRGQEDFGRNCGPGCGWCGMCS